MKVIVTGATGSGKPLFNPKKSPKQTDKITTVGSAALQQCIEHPEVTSIIALTRRPLEVQDSKLEAVIVKDFLDYDDAVIQKMKGADGCIW